MIDAVFNIIIHVLSNSVYIHSIFSHIVFFSSSGWTLAAQLKMIIAHFVAQNNKRNSTNWPIVVVESFRMYSRDTVWFYWTLKLN